MIIDIESTRPVRAVHMNPKQPAHHRSDKELTLGRSSFPTRCSTVCRRNGALIPCLSNLFVQRHAPRRRWSQRHVEHNPSVTGANPRCCLQLLMIPWSLRRSWLMALFFWTLPTDTRVLKKKRRDKYTMVRWAASAKGIDESKASIR